MSEAKGDCCNAYTQAEHDSVRLLIDVAERYVIAVMENGVSTEALEDVVDILEAIQVISTLFPLTEPSA